MDARESRYQAWMQEREQSGLRRYLRDISHDDRARIIIDGRRYINFSGNDYLGLAAHPALIKRSSEWGARYGAGAGASRLVTGNLDIFTAIEAKIAALKGKPAALVMASGFQTNAAVLQAILDKSVLRTEPLVFSDRLNHASMHFGCQAAGVHQHRYRHCDMNHLRRLLEEHAGQGKPSFILTESVFSMDGDVAPLNGIMALARAHGAFVICDDAHATGVLGEGGCGLSGDADIVIGTFSKALGSYGAYVACSGPMRDYLINRCAGLIYSTALPPPVLGAVDASLDLLPELDEERAHVADMAASFRNGARALGFDTGLSTTQIIPVMVGGADEALALSARLAEAGYWATAIRPPTVAKGSARLRLAFSAMHSEEDIDGLLKILEAQASRNHAS